MRKSLGSKRNELSPEQIGRVVALYEAFDEADASLSKVFANEEFGCLTVSVERPLRDERGGVIRDRKGRPKPDKALHDTENISLTEDVDAYMAREVLSYAPDAWIEPRKNKVTKVMETGTVGYEIPFTRYFYEHKPLRPSSEVLADLRELEARISGELARVVG